jgi:hypothetical protein
MDPDQLDDSVVTIARWVWHHLSDVSNALRIIDTLLKWAKEIIDRFGPRPQTIGMETIGPLTQVFAPTVHQASASGVVEMSGSLAVRRIPRTPNC